MNGQVKVAWRTLRTISNYLIVHDRFSEAYNHFTLMYTTDNIFPVLPIKYMTNEDGNPTTPFKLATDTKPSVSHLRVLFFHFLNWKSTTHVEKGVKYVLPSTTGFSRYIDWNSTASKIISSVRTK